jgi:hypothetical protein
MLRGEGRSSLAIQRKTRRTCVEKSPKEVVAEEAQEQRAGQTTKTMKEMLMPP